MASRQPKYEKEYIIDKLEEYIEETELPIFKEVCYLNNWCDDYIYQLSLKDEDIARTIKKLRQKKESELERGGLTGKYSHTMAIFSLKQLGWKDRVELDTKDSGLNINIKNGSLTEEDIERVKKLKERLFKNDN